MSFIPVKSKIVKLTQRFVVASMQNSVQCAISNNAELCSICIHTKLSSLDIFVLRKKRHAFQNNGSETNLNMYSQLCCILKRKG